MSRAVLISINPKWCQKIVSGEKTIEVRKTKPNLKTPFKCYIYCTYGEGLIEYSDMCYPNELLGIKVSRDKIWGNCCNGKVIGEFMCDRVQEFNYWNYEYPNNASGEYYIEDDALKKACIPYSELADYGQGKTLYGWYISNLFIYDKPLELSEFMRPCTNDLFCEACAMYYEFEERCGNRALMLKKAPQSWCYVED